MVVLPHPLGPSSEKNSPLPGRSSTVKLMLSIAESYLASRRMSSPLWRGSRYTDLRIRRALALADEKIMRQIAGKKVVKEVYVPKRLVNIVVKE
jgi:leucyl-tRNA synthetase